MNYLLRTRRWSGTFFLLLLAISGAVAQSTAGYGDWQLYLPNNRAKALAEAGNRVYVATEDALFFYDKELNTTQLLSSRDGLHDVGVSTLGYDPVTKQVLVVYRNGNLDFITADGRILNVSDIQRKTIAGDKTVGHISFNKGRAYLSAGFGLVVVDMAKREIRDTYGNIGPSGAPVAVYATTVLDNTLFAATSAGLMRGQLTDNLLDYRRWIIDLPSASAATARYHSLATFGKYVYAGVDAGNLLCYNCGPTPWQPDYSIYVGGRYQQLTASAAGLLAVGDGKVTLIKSVGNTERLLTTEQSPAPQAVLQSQTGDFYVADYQHGLVKLSANKQVEKFTTNAPASARAFSVLADARSNTVDIFSGGYTDRYVQQEWQGGFFEYKDGKWTNFTSEGFKPTPAFPKFKDITRGLRTKDGTLYLATYGNGLLKWTGAWEYEQFTEGTPGSPLKSAIPGSLDYVRITDLAKDSKDNVWVVNRHPELRSLSGLHQYLPASNTWKTMPYFNGFDNLDRIVVDDNDYVWASQSRKEGIGLVAYDPEEQSSRYFNSNNSELPANEIYDLAKDRKGNIWVATAKGIAVFNDPSTVFLATNAGNFQQPIIRRGTTTGYRALRDEVVKTVAVDGANRKWFGTERGLWLFSEDADEGLLHFTTENSPLPSNNIVDVEVNDKTGEVFVITDAGLVSYRGSATVTEGKPDCARVSPNPVRTDFTGQVGISGLANNGLVKITDVTGKLVYQTKANGGTVVWDLADYNGRKVQSGVYLLLSSDADGKNGCISKIAVVQK
ncbi:type IX secretion system anionic LPS delivery protein PorZ [Hymenobacter chitinivorans]|uniref:Putative secreted protein (Por secretion system target) n=1 Tax=Hymenobacter chitinivorans DSM 11115 TaxID=1121954 RepID=A0A2M9AQ55_9BACT|nr:T9SS type A sorting domain-containing protein [Hymenobacter chitinivorans]PJJ47773.1 putative secreted protein (Por secretion system target) [Hymenobacter chitinivorans DSM 11115]